MRHSTRKGKIVNAHYIVFANLIDLNSIKSSKISKTPTCFRNVILWLFSRSNPQSIAKIYSSARRGKGGPISSRCVRNLLSEGTQELPTGFAPSGSVESMFSTTYFIRQNTNCRGELILVTVYFVIEKLSSLKKFVEHYRSVIMHNKYILGLI